MQDNCETEVAYELDRDTTNLRHWEDLDAEAWLWKFPGWKNVAFWKAERLDLPEPVVFDSVDELIRESDFPYTNITRWPVMSKRMLEALLSVQEFPNQIISVEMRDNQQILDRQSGEYVPSELVSYDFVIANVLGWQDVFDWDKSEYTPLEGVPGAVKRIKKLVLKEPEQGLPPLFRLSAFPGRLFISAAGKRALESIVIKGVRFIPASRFR